MSQELFYTSAPRGLRPGTQGFCSVAITRGMSAALVERLEELSSYRPAFPPYDGRAALNPVVHAHWRLAWGSKPVHVLSRICAAGLDYSQRHNKFAHHVVLEGAELPEAGPAWLLQQPGFMATAWDGEVKVLPAGRRPPRGSSTPAICQAWQRVTGDAGWAGVLAHSLVIDPGRVAYLIFEAGFDPLPLLVEAVALLPVHLRWEATFNTYYTGLPQSARCSWRCVLSGSPEAIEAEGLPGALVLNLGGHLGRAPDGDLTQFARTGRRSASASAEEPPVPRLAPVLVREEFPTESDRGRAVPSPKTFPPLNTPLSGSPRRPPPPPRLAVPAESTTNERRVGHIFAAGLALGFAAALLLAGGVFTLRWLLAPGEQPPPPAAELNTAKSLGESTLEGMRLLDGKIANATKAEAEEASLNDFAELLQRSTLRTLADVLRHRFNDREKLRQLEQQMAQLRNERDAARNEARWLIELRAGSEPLESLEKRLSLARRLWEGRKEWLVLAHPPNGGRLRPDVEDAIRKSGEELDRLEQRLMTEDADLDLLERDIDGAIKELGKIPRKGWHASPEG